MDSAVIFVTDFSFVLPIALPSISRKHLTLYLSFSMYLCLRASLCHKDKETVKHDIEIDAPLTSLTAQLARSRGEWKKAVSPAKWKINIQPLINGLVKQS